MINCAFIPALSINEDSYHSSRGTAAGIGHYKRCVSLASFFSKNGHECQVYLEDLLRWQHEKPTNSVKHIYYSNFEWLKTHIDRQESGITHIIYDMNYIDKKFLDLSPNSIKVNLAPRGNNNKKFDYSFLDTNCFQLECSTNVFSGPEYCILDEGLDKLYRSDITSIRDSIESPEIRILITMGGTDPGSLTLKVIDQLINNNKDNNIYIDAIVPISMSRNIHEFPSNQYITYHPLSNSLSNLVSRNDVVICTSGCTLTQMALINKPVIGICPTDYHTCRCNETRNFSSSCLCLNSDEIFNFNLIQLANNLLNESALSVKRRTKSFGKELILKILLSK